MRASIAISPRQLRSPSGGEAVTGGELVGNRSARPPNSKDHSKFKTHFGVGAIVLIFGLFVIAHFYLAVHLLEFLLRFFRGVQRIGRRALWPDRSGECPGTRGCDDVWCDLYRTGDGLVVSDGRQLA
jgi:hypothetical protein